MRKQPLKVNQAVTQHWIPACCKSQAGCQVFFKELGVYLGNIYFQKRGKQLSFSRSLSVRAPLSPWCLHSSAREAQTLPWAGSPGADQWHHNPQNPFWEAWFTPSRVCHNCQGFWPDLAGPGKSDPSARPSGLCWFNKPSQNMEQQETTSWGLETL